MLGFLDQKVLAVLNRRPLSLCYTAPEVRRLLKCRYNVNAVQASLERLVRRGWAEHPFGHPGLFTASMKELEEESRRMGQPSG